jgi:hypothetical protein
MSVTRAGSEATRLSIELALQVQALVRVVEDEPAIPASEICVALHHLAAFEFGLAQALQHLTVCVQRSAASDLFWAADASDKTAAWALAGVASAARRLGEAEQHTVQIAILLTDACEDLFPEAHALKKRLLACGVTLPETETAIEVPATTAKTPRVREERAAAHPAEHDSDWMTSEQAAAVLGISVTTIKTTWVRHKVGPPRHRVDGYFAYRRSEVITVRDARRALRDAKNSAA